MPTGWLPKLTLVGLNCMYVPMPVSGSDWGLPVALSVAAMEPVRVPFFPLGLNVTLIVQLAPALTVAPQVFVSANEPETVIPVTVRIPPPNGSRAVGNAAPLCFLSVTSFLTHS